MGHSLLATPRLGSFADPLASGWILQGHRIRLDGDHAPGLRAFAGAILNPKCLTWFEYSRAPCRILPGGESPTGGTGTGVIRWPHDAADTHQICRRGRIGR